MDTPWVRAKKTKSELQEERLGAMPGGSKQINSGRTTHRSPRDNKLYEFLIEARTTGKDFYRIEGSEWIDLRAQSLRHPPGCRPAMQVDLERLNLNLLVMELRDFEGMKLELEGLRARVEELEEELDATNNRTG
jgi:hypothetical protein